MKLNLTSTLACVATFIYLSLGMAFGQEAPPSQPGQTYVASVYGSYQSAVYQGNTSTGSQSIVAQPVTVNLNNGLTTVPFLANTPITVDRGASNAETVTPTVTNCYTGSINCTLTATFTYTHVAGEALTSGTFGLQEAINAASANKSGTVIIDNTWAGPAGTSLITAAIGSVNVVLEDTRSGFPVWYRWNGSSYIVATTYTLESFLSTADGHNGQDYGFAATAFCNTIGCSTLQTPVVLKTTAPGICKVFTTITLPGPIQFDGSSCTLVPQSAMAQSYVNLTSCSTTIGSNAVTCASTTGLSAGMAIGGDATIGPENYIASVTNSTTFQLALPASRNITGVVTNGSNTVVGVDNLQDIANGQTLVNTLFIPTNTTISGIAYGATQSLTLSANTTGGSAIPMTMSLANGTVISGLSLQAISQNPVILVPQAPNALKKAHGANFGASLAKVTIADPNYNYVANSFGRTLPGVVGVQIYGYDNYTISELSVFGLDGSGLVIGGYVPSTQNNGAVRESDFGTVYVYSSGDVLTGQAAIALMTGLGSNATTGSGADEINQISFQNAHAVQSDAENLVIGTYLHAGTNNGPRLLWFGGDTQFEDVIGPYSFNNSDTVRILNGGSTIKFTGGEYTTPGFGKSTFHVSLGSDLSITGSNFASIGESQIYNVSIASGSPTVTYVSANTNAGSQFPSSAYLNGIGALLNDGASCTPCTVFLVPTGAVNAVGTALTLATNYAGAQTTATLQIQTGGFYANLDQTTSLTQLVSTSNTYASSVAAVAAMLGTSSTSTTFTVGQKMFNGLDVLSDYPSGSNTGFSGPVTLPASTGQIGAPSMTLFMHDWYLGPGSVTQQGTVTIQMYPGTGADPSQYLYFTQTLGYGDFYNNITNNTSGNGTYQNLTSTGSNKAAFGVVGNTQAWQWGMLSNSLWSLRDSTASVNVVTVAPASGNTAWLGTQTAPAFYPQTLAAGPYAALFDDFVSASAIAGGSVGSPTSASCTLSGTKTDINHPGTIRILSGTGASGTGENCVEGSQPTIVSPQTGPGWTWESIVYPEFLPASQASSYEAGLVAQNGQGVMPWITGMGFYLSSANANANHYYCAYGITPTLVDSGVAATAAWTRLTMVQNGTNLLWYVNGTQVCSVAIGSLPTASVYTGAWTAVTNTASTATALDVDYVNFQRQVTR